MRLLKAYRKDRALPVAVGLSMALVMACQEESPTSIAEGDLPGSPVTVEILLPWSDFASNLEVFGGFGSPEDLRQGVVANQFAGTLNARTLLRFLPYPTVVTVRDSAGTARPDADLTYIGGTLIAFFDTLASTNVGPVNLGLGATQSTWDATTVTWTFAADTVNDPLPWGEPGAGPVTDLGMATWDPAAGDSVLFTLDSATVNAWADSTDLSRGARIELFDAGPRLQMNGAILRLNVRPSLDPDTVIELVVGTRDITFVYDPNPEPPPDGVRVGGAPAWRTVLDVGINPILTGPAEICAVVSCPHTLTAGQVSHAALVLTSRATDPAFQPTDSIGLDVRPVFNRAAMPKAPLGNSLVLDLLGRRVGPDAFGSAPGQVIEIPFTKFIRDLVRGEREDGSVAPTALVLLTVFEPISIAFASFEGPGSPNEPFLRLILTIGPPIRLP